MLPKEFRDPCPVFLQLPFQYPQLLGEGDSQATLRVGNGLGTAELSGSGKLLQSFLIRLRAIEFVDVKKLLPASPARLHQGFRRGKLLDKRPGSGPGPVVKRLQGRRVILRQSLLELIDQGRPLLDEMNLVADYRRQ